MTTTGKICKAITRSGQSCRAYALAGSDYCFRHDPTKAAERQQASAKGGYARHGRQIGNVGPAEPVTLTSVQDVVKLLESEVNAVLGLEVSLSRAQTIARLALAFVKCFEVSELQQRLAAIEWALKLRKEE